MQHPKIYQINTWTWLHGLSQQHGERITLANLPDDVFESEMRFFDAVWLMGVWERSPVGRQVALEHPDLQAEYRRALPDFTPDDVVGSPYSVKAYQVAEYLGGREGLAIAREQLAARGLRLILDYVPNHVARDHAWTQANPTCLIQGTPHAVAERPAHFFQVNNIHFAYGRDPYFAPWTDTAQVNAFSPSARRASMDILQDIADQCDGVRCDMAMLLTTDIFARTWNDLAGERPDDEFWEVVIPAVRAEHPDFLFMAEVYWDMEYALQQQGFDYCYDKRLYDRLAHESVEAIKNHLVADWDYQRKLVRFIENHDEPRAAATFEDDQQQAAAVMILTLPGARLVHEGQARGHRVKLPVQLGRRPQEEDNLAMLAFYEQILKHDIDGDEWHTCAVSGTQDETYQNLIAYRWPEYLIVINYSDAAASGYIDLPDGQWQLTDIISGEFAVYPDVATHPPFVQLPAWGWRIFASVR